MKLCGLPCPSLVRNTVSAASSSRKCRKYNVRFPMNINIESPLYLRTQWTRVQRDVRRLNTTIVEGPIERRKSRSASRKTSDGLTGTYSGGSFDRTESVPKWSRKRRACAGLREASQRDKAMRSMPPFPPEKDSFRFFIFVWWLLYYLQVQSTAVVIYCMSLVTRAP